MPIFSSVARKYYESGYSVIPLHIKGKHPFLNGWQEYCHLKAHDITLEQWESAYPDNNIGLCCGEASKIVALDFDHDTPEGVHAKILAIAGQSPVRKTGAKGFTAFYKWTGEHNKKWRVDGVSVLELLSTGNQTVLPPSIHPDTGKEYIWTTEDTLGDVDLPSLPKDFIEKIDTLFGYTQRIKATASTDEAPPLARVREAMAYIDATPYATWLEVGMALNHAYGDEGFALWDTWSGKAINYKQGECEKKWRSFGKYTGQRLTAATIMHYAIGAGYVPEVTEEERGIFDAIVAGVGKQSPVAGVGSHQQRGSASADITPLTNSIPPYLLKCPGLPGQIAEWITNSAFKPQPVLALAAALCAVGTIMGHRYRSETNLRTNIYAIGILPSGAGKDHARDCIDALFCALGMGENLFEDYSSDTALINSLSRANNLGLAIPDEIGRELQSIGSGKGNGHEQRLLTTYMKLFSKAKGTFRGKEYANHDGKQERKTLINPCFGLYGVTTPDNFYSSLSSGQAIDGFLSRFLIFEADRSKRRGAGVVNVPEKVLEQCVAIRNLDVRPPDGIYMDTFVPPVPIIVPLSEGAREIYNALQEREEDYAEAETKAGTGYDALWVRCHEHAAKIALCCHSGGEINADVMQYAAALAEWLTARSIGLAKQHIADSEYQISYNSILGAITRFWERNHKPMQRSQLARICKRIPARQRNEIISHLHEAGEILVSEVETSNQHKMQMYLPFSAKDDTVSE